MLNENPSDCLASWGCAGRSRFLFGVVRDCDAVEILGESARGRAGGGDGARVAVCDFLRGAFAGDDRGEVVGGEGGSGFWGVVCAVGAVLAGCAAPGLGSGRDRGNWGLEGLEIFGGKRAGAILSGLADASDGGGGDGGGFVAPFAADESEDGGDLGIGEGVEGRHFQFVGAFPNGELAGEAAEDDAGEAIFGAEDPFGIEDGRGDAVEAQTRGLVASGAGGGVEFFALGETSGFFGGEFGDGGRWGADFAWPSEEE